MKHAHLLNTTLACSLAFGAVSLAAAATPANAEMKPGTAQMQAWHQRMETLIKKDHYAKCYGINAAYKNECGSPGNACGWNDPKARDPNAWVLLPAGLCEKIEGGSLQPAKK